MSSDVPQFDNELEPHEPPGVHPLAAAALGLALLGLAVPLVLAASALFIAPIAKRKIRAQPEHWTGIGIVSAAQMIAVMQVIALVVILWSTKSFY